MGLISAMRNAISPQRADEGLGSVLRSAAQIERDAAAEKAARTKEMLAPELFSLLAGDSEDAKFRRITSPSTMRDLNPLMHLRMQQVCFFLAVTTPFGRRILQLITDYVVGEGFSAKAQDQQTQDVIDKFWDDPTNNLDENIEAWTHDLLMLGELCLPTAVNPVDGSVRLGYVDPQEIEFVEYGLMQTAISQEVTIPIAVHLVKRIGEDSGRRLEIIHTDEDAQSPGFGQLKGDCFYFAINKAKSASRGISELFALADWIDVFDQMMFDFADRVRFLNAFVWHYVVKGGDEKQVQKLRDDVTKRPPRQGGIQVTNDQVEINAQTPDLKGADMSQAAEVVKTYGLGGAGMPKWFFADAQNANRATAQEMQGPTGKMLTSRQNVMKRIVRAVVDYAVEQATAHGVLSPDGNLEWNLDVPDLSVRDIAATATAMQTVSQSCAVAEDRGWIRSKTAARAFHTLLTSVGVEVDADEFDRAQKNKVERDANSQDGLLPQKNLADALKKPPLPGSPGATGAAEDPTPVVVQ